MCKRLLFALSLLFLLSDISFPEPSGLVSANQGMVVSLDRRASEAGIGILRKGGNAVDAAVAVGYALAVLEPEAGNLGGGGFMLVYRSNGKSSIAIDYRELAPEAASPSMYINAEGEVEEERSLSGYLASGVPGTVAGLNLALERYGTMTRAEVLQPAIQLAEEGFIVDEGLAKLFERHRDRLDRFPETRSIFLRRGTPYQQGEQFVQSDLAKTLRLIASDGSSAFYAGLIAESMARQFAVNGGFLTKADLAGYQPVIRRPLVGRYHGYRIVTMPPPSAGGVMLVEMLNMLKKYDLHEAGYHSVEAVHLLAEVMRRAYADRAAYLGDPDFVSIPLFKLLSSRYARDRARSIERARATPSQKLAPHGHFFRESRNTTHFSIIDRFGNAVANTTTLNTSFGSGVTIKGWGFLMNNEMNDFNLSPDYADTYGLVSSAPNSIAPGKRMLSSMMPTIVLKKNQPYLVLGSPGGGRIITSVLQVLLHVVDYRKRIDEAVQALRFHHQWMPDRLVLEEELSAELADGLVRRGHQIKRTRAIGCVQAIAVDLDSNLYLGAADPRRLGSAALGYSSTESFTIDD